MFARLKISLSVSRLAAFGNRYRLVLLFAIVALPFLLVRLPFYLYYPMVSLTPDSWTYARPAYQILNGTLPQFDHRTPGYPLFIALLFKLFRHPSNLTIVLSQGALSLSSLLFLVYAIYKKYPEAALYAAVAIAGYATSVTFLWYESNYMTESLYVSFLVLFFAFVIISLHSKKALPWTVTSFIVGYIIWIRPAGIFILLVAAMVAAFLIKNRYPRRTIAALIVPCAMMLVVLAGYNRFTIGSFTLSPFGAHNLFSLTIPFMEPDERFSADINRAITEYVNTRVSEEIKRTVRASWDIEALHDAFITAYEYNLAITFDFLRSVKTPNATPSTPMMGLYPALNDIAMAQIKRHPLIYLKFFSVMAVYYLTNVRRDEAGIEGGANIYKITIPFAAQAIKAYHNTTNSAEEDTVDKAAIEFTLNEYLRPFPPEMKNVYWFISTGGDNSTTEVLYVKDVKTPLMAAGIAYQRYHRMVFRNILWTAVYFMVLAYGVFVLFRRKYMDTGAFIVVILCACPLFSALVTSAVTTALVRYSYPTEICYYLPAALLPVLWRYHSLKIKNAAAAINENPTM
ncbi:MAG: glycosyltransferase family 39 protein [Nitrospirae bacterium]|nr:glycosyltransferase family 39 protein [Nitrospirota bacterium]